MKDLLAASIGISTAIGLFISGVINESLKSFPIDPEYTWYLTDGNGDINPANPVTGGLMTITEFQEEYNFCGGGETDCAHGFLPGNSPATAEDDGDITMYKE